MNVPNTHFLRKIMKLLRGHLQHAYFIHLFASESPEIYIFFLFLTENYLQMNTTFQVVLELLIKACKNFLLIKNSRIVWPITILILTLNCIRYPALPWCITGGSMEPPRENTFPPNFLIIFTPYVYTLITTIFQEKKYKIFVPFQNGGQITDFHFVSFRFWSKFENHFPKGIFQWNLAQIRRSWIY